MSAGNAALTCHRFSGHQRQRDHSAVHVQRRIFAKLPISIACDACPLLDDGILIRVRVNAHRITHFFRQTRDALNMTRAHLRRNEHQHHLLQLQAGFEQPKRIKRCPN